MKVRNILTALVFGLALLAPGRVLAHCDSVDGPVVRAARKALDTGNLALALIWVQASDEAEIRSAFTKTLVVRALSPQSKGLADRYFFETIVRVHRDGEGAPYTGLKPAGWDFGPAIPAADKALQDASPDPVLTLLMQAMDGGLRRRFEAAFAASTFDPSDLSEGRQYVRAYVEFIHYVERLYEAIAASPHHQAETGEGGDPR
jgi:DNA-binding FadR family transcriptional regulator